LSIDLFFIIQGFIEHFKTKPHTEANEEQVIVGKDLGLLGRQFYNECY